MKWILAGIAASLAASLPLAAQAQSEAENRCRSEIAGRGWSGYSIERIQQSGNTVDAIARAGSDVLAFQCDFDNAGNVLEIRVEKASGYAGNPGRVTERTPDAYQRGYSDGYQAGWDARRRR